MISKLLFAALLSAGIVNAAQANMRITEWMYSQVNTSGEFVEFTNMGASAIDMTGWSYDDDSRLPGVFVLSGLGTVAVGESVIITETTAATFRTQWGLADNIKVLGGVSNNLGRNDEINLFDNTNSLVDRLTYGDQTFAGTIRTQGKSGNPVSLAAIGTNNPNLWVLSSLGDAEGSRSALGDIGNPGMTQFANPVPEPETYALMLAGLGLLGFMARRRKA